MRRRDLVIFIGGAMAWTSAARGQEPRRVIGVLGAFIGASMFPGALPAFFQGLKETGFIEGKNLRSFPDFAGKERFAFGEQRTSSPLASIV